MVLGRIPLPLLSRVRHQVRKNYSHSFIEYLLGPGTLLRIYYAFSFKPHKQLEQTVSETLSNLSKDTQLESDN